MSLLGSVASAMTTAFSSIVTDLTNALVQIAPIAIPVIGIGLVVTVGIKPFKSVTNKSGS